MKKAFNNGKGLLIIQYTGFNPYNGPGASLCRSRTTFFFLVSYKRSKRGAPIGSLSPLRGGRACDRGTFYLKKEGICGACPIPSNAP